MSAGRRQDGFVLPLTLLMLATVMLLVAAFGRYASDSALAAARALDAARAEHEIGATIETLRYSLLRRRLTYLGLRAGRPSFEELEQQRRLYERAAPDLRAATDLRFDGTVYRGIGDTRFAVYDDAALVGIDFRGRTFGRFLAAAGRDPGLATALLNRLADYVDEDEFRRLEGAEAPAYRAEGLPPPRNGRLLNPLELGSVLGWDALLAGREAGKSLYRLLSDQPGAGPNLNTSPPAVLASLAVLRDEEIPALVAARPLGTVAGLARTLGRPVAVSTTEARAIPSTVLRFVAEHPGLPRPLATVFSMHLGGYNEAPWSTRWTLRSHAFSLPDAPAEPPRPALLAAPAR